MHRLCSSAVWLHVFHAELILAHFGFGGCRICDAACIVHFCLAVQLMLLWALWPMAIQLMTSWGQCSQMQSCKKWQKVIDLHYIAV